MNILVVGAAYAVLTLIMFHYFTYSFIYCVFVVRAWRLYLLSRLPLPLLFSISSCACCVGCCTTSGEKLSQGKFQKFRNDM